jgi:hypothetical protein
MRGAAQMRGVTIVEICIVLVIIGLLIGGVLGGQELLQNYRINKMIDQTKQIDAAFTLFKKNYGELPGDISSITRLANCTAAPCSTAGNGDGRIQGGTLAYTTMAALTDERVTGWAHLKAADLIQMEGGTLLEPGQALPETAMDGMWRMGYLDENGAGRQIDYANIIFPSRNNTTTWREVMPARYVQMMDKKMDDGGIFTGRLQGTMNIDCNTGPEYNITTNTNACTYFYLLDTQF